MGTRALMKLLRVGFGHPLLLLFVPLGLMSRGQCSDLHRHPLHALRAPQQSVDACELSTSYLVLASVLTCLILIRHLHKASGNNLQLRRHSTVPSNGCLVTPESWM